MKFVKMHGLGNDYILVNCFVQTIHQPGKVAEAVSRYHFGIGADGMILVCSSETADCRMRMFNADGTEGVMCGNGIRCVGKLAYDYGIAAKPEIAVETRDGVKLLKVTEENGKAAALCVDMGTARPEGLEPISVAGKDWNVFVVDVGSKHAVYVVEDCEAVPLKEIGSLFEHHSRFPDRVNSEFVQVLDRKQIRMRVWERGSGITLACGTGACASVIACHAQGLTDREVDVVMDGGTLHISLGEDGHVYMTGPAAEVFTGEIDIDEWDCQNVGSDT